MSGLSNMASHNFINPFLIYKNAARARVGFAGNIGRFSETVLTPCRPNTRNKTAKAF
jgi:hypothetical protein